MEIIIPLADESGTITGYEEKLEVHRKGLLHLAFSVLIFNAENKIMLQKRASGKYHSPSLWTNTCCGHPNKGEEIKDAASRRLQEEMGISPDLSYQFTFHYRADFPNGLTENEIDHVFFGSYDKDPVLNPEEADDFAWKTIPEIREDIELSPEKYTVWFREIMKQLEVI